MARRKFLVYIRWRKGSRHSHEMRWLGSVRIGGIGTGYQAVIYGPPRKDVEHEYAKEARGKYHVDVHNRYSAYVRTLVAAKKKAKTLVKKWYIESHR